MRILSFDTAVMGCSVAVMDTVTGKSWTDTVVTERGQAELLVPMIRSVMEQAHAGFADIDRIAVTTGPGSFTGVRIGLATARALSLASGIPVLGFETLHVLAAQVSKTQQDGQRILALVDTKREDFYGQMFEASVPVENARIWSRDEVSRVRSGNEVHIHEGNPDILTLALLASDAPLTGRMPEPVYLRGAEVSQPKRQAPQAV